MLFIYLSSFNYYFNNIKSLFKVYIISFYFLIVYLSSSLNFNKFYNKSYYLLISSCKLNYSPTLLYYISEKFYNNAILFVI